MHGKPDVEPAQQRFRMLAVLCLWLFCVAFDTTKLVVALPTIGRAFGAPAQTLKWVIEGHLLVYAAFLLLGGMLSERFGARRILLVGVALFGVASLGAALAGSIPVLVGCRVLLGVGAALTTPAALAAIKQGFSAAERPRAVALWTASFGAGAALGPLVAGWILERWAWGFVLLANLPAAFWIFVGASRLVPAGPTRRDVPLDLCGSVLVLAASSALIYAVLEGPYLGWGSLPVLGAMAGAALLYPLWIAWQARTTHPMLDLSLFRSARFASTLLVIVLSYLSFSGVSFVLAQYLQLSLGHGPWRAGLCTLPLALCMLAGTLLAPVMSRRFGDDRALRIALASACVGAGLLSLASVCSGAIWLFVGEACFGGGCGAAFANATDQVVASAPSSRAGSAAAINETAFELGGVLGVAILGTVQARGGAHEAAGNSAARALGVAGGALCVALFVLHWAAPRGLASRSACR